MEAMGTCEICNIPGKGMGVKAKRDIKKGEIIFTERPILRYTGGENELLRSKDVNFRKIYDGEFQMLSRNVKEDIMKLGNRAKLQSNDEFLQLVGIWATNSFGLDMEISESGEKQTGLFIDASKFNHSCIANAEHCFIEPYMRIYAVQDIAKGEEICISYWGLIEFWRRTRFDKRPTIPAYRQFISESFDCKCELCKMNDTKKYNLIEKHRIKCWELTEKYKIPHIPKTQLELCEDVLIEMKLAKIGSLVDVQDIAHTGWMVALICNQDTKVDFFIEQEYVARIAMFGENDPTAKHFWKVMNDPVYRKSWLGNSEYRKEIKKTYFKYLTLESNTVLDTLRFQKAFDHYNMSQFTF